VRNLDQVYEWEQVRSQGLITQVDHSILGKIEIPGSPLRWFDSEGEITPTLNTAPPALGEQSDAVRRWLGF
jgi:crotonobetainyl-CoA:carnitine CoA-transferase CaiB-like acyl-CoA transferase